MNNNKIFLKLGQTFSKKLVSRGSNGVVLTEGFGTLISNGLEQHNIAIKKNTSITINSFDFYLSKVVLTCIKDKEVYTAAVPFSFLLNNCTLNEIDKNKVVDTVYLHNTIHEVISRESLFYFILYVVVLFCGIMIGKI